MNSIPHHKLLLARDIQPAGRITVNNPFDLTPIAEVDTLGPESIQQVLSDAQALYKDRDNWLPAHERIAILKRTAELIAERSEQLAREAAAEGGKPLIDSRIEVARAIDGVRNCAELLRNTSGSEIPMGATAASQGRLAFTTHEPIGPVVAVSAFNHPFNLIVHQVGPAVASGCPVIVKPAEDTPLSCLNFIRLLREAGLPDGWAQVVMTDGIPTAEALVTDPRVAFFSFIGSPGVGWHLRSKLAPGTRCALEHGGAAPVIVGADADLEDMLPLLAKGGFYHAGQVCVSVQRVFVQRERAREVANALAAMGREQKVGDALDEQTEIGPLIRPAEVTRVQDWVNQAVSAGAELLCGGEPISETCYPATVLFDPPQETEVSRREVFGPVICVYPYDDPADAVSRANALPYAFQASVFGKDIDSLLGAARRLDASAVMINDHTAFRVDWMPFAGLKQSGLGTGGIPYSFHDMQVEKLLVIRSNAL